MSPLLCFVLAHCALLVHYKFWSDTSQVITDFSGNNNHAVNGSSSLDLIDDAILTARGAYFPGAGLIKMPPNNEVASGVDLGTSYSFVTWVLMFDDESNILNKSLSGVLRMRLRYLLVGTQRVMRSRVSDVVNNCLGDGHSQLLKDTWVSIAVRVECTSRCHMIGYQNGVEVLLVTCPIFAFADDPTSDFDLGGVTLGFMYEFKAFNHLISTTELASEFVQPWAGECPGVCSSFCVTSPAVQCLSACPYVLITDSCSAVCPCRSSQCVGSCHMSRDACVLTGCIDTVYYDTVSALLCDGSCFACTGPSAAECISCIDPGAEVVSGVCHCKAGMYQSSGNPFVCGQCDSTCDSCTGGTASDCVSCKTLAEFSGSHTCVCVKGSFPEADASHCVLCDSYCSECIKAGPSGCSKCKQSAYLGGPPPSLCFCNPGFFDESSACIQCPDSCETCSGPSECLSCKGIAVLNKGTCDCSAQGHYGNAANCRLCSENCIQCTEFLCTKCTEGLIALENTCVQSCPTGFRIDSDGSICEQGDMQAPVPSLTVTSDNSLLVTFDKPMSMKLVSSDVSVEVSDSSFRIATVSWSEPILDSPQAVSFKLTFRIAWLPPGFTATLTFLYPAKVTDTYGMAIETTTVSAEVNAFGSESVLQPSLQHGEAARQAKAMSQAGVSAGLMNSLVTGSSSPLISLINQLQLISYVAMSDLKLSEEFAQTLAALNVGFMIPNPISQYMSMNDNSQKPPAQIENYGVDSTVFLLNSLSFLGVCGTIAGSSFPTFILSKMKIAAIAQYFQALLPSYRWSTPLKLWLTSYLDLGIFSLLQLRNHSVSGAFLGVSTCSAGVTAFLFLATPCFLVVFLHRYSQAVVKRDNPGFNSRWGAVFLPFKQTPKAAVLIYYPLFAVRRVALGVTLAVTYGSVKLFALANSLLGLVTFAFLILLRPYEDRLDSLEAITIEAMTVSVYVLASFSAFDISESTNATIGAVGMWTVRVAIACNVVLSSLRSIVAVVSLVKGYRERMMRAKEKYRVQTEANTITSGRFAQRH